MTKVVINTVHGGFGLSEEAIELYLKRSGQIYCKVADGKLSEIMERSEFYLGETPDDENYFSDGDIPRDDSTLVSVVEELGKKADGRFAALKVVDIPDGVEWVLEEYDGAEWVAEEHQKWY